MAAETRSHSFNNNPRMCGYSETIRNEINFVRNSCQSLDKNLKKAQNKWIYKNITKKKMEWTDNRQSLDL